MRQQQQKEQQHIQLKPTRKIERSDIKHTVHSVSISQFQYLLINANKKNNDCKKIVEQKSAIEK